MIFDPFFYEVSPRLSLEVLNTPISGSGHTVSASNGAIKALVSVMVVLTAGSLAYFVHRIYVTHKYFHFKYSQVNGKSTIKDAIHGNKLQRESMERKSKLDQDKPYTEKKLRKESSSSSDEDIQR